MTFKFSHFIFAVALGISMIGCKKQGMDSDNSENKDNIFISICKKDLEQISGTKNIVFSVSEPLFFHQIKNRINYSEKFQLQDIGEKDDLYRICTYGPKSHKPILGGTGIFVVNQRLRSIVYRMLGK